MNILRYLNFFALVITGFSLLCSVDTTTGTAGSETVNTFALVVCDESANPVSGASVRIVAAETWLRKMVSETNPLLSQATSGNDGMVRLPSDSIYETTINLCADIGSIAVFLESFPVNNLADSIPDTIIIKPATELSGVITSNAILPERIVLQGTDYSARVDQATGNYRFSAVPAGDYHIVAIDADNRLTGVGTIDLHGESERTDSFEADFSGIRVDDFDGART